MAGPTYAVGNVRTSGPIADTLWQFFSEMLHTNALEEFYPRLFFHDMARLIRHPGNKGLKGYIPQWTKVSPVVELQVEGQGTPGANEEFDHTPATPTIMEMTNYSYEIQGWGGFFPFTDVYMAVTEMVETLVAGTRMLGGSYASVTENNALKKLIAGLNDTGLATRPIKIGGNGKAWGSVITASDFLTMNDIIRVGTEFSASADGHTPTYEDGTYKGIIHARQKHDLFVPGSFEPSMMQWLQTSQGQGMFESGKVPVLNNVAIYVSSANAGDPFQSNQHYQGNVFPTTGGGITPGPEANPFTTNTNASRGYISWFFAPGAFAAIDLANALPSIIVQPFGSGGATGDPFKRIMTISIKGYQTATLMEMNRRCVALATGAATVPVAY